MISSWAAVLIAAQSRLPLPPPELATAVADGFAADELAADELALDAGPLLLQAARKATSSAGRTSLIRMCGILSFVHEGEWADLKG